MADSSRHLLVMAVACLFATAASDGIAQQPDSAGPIFSERFATVFDPASGTYFSVQGTEGKQFGGQQPFLSISANHYEGFLDDAVTLYSGQYMINYNRITGIPAGTLGVQQRWLTQLPSSESAILGAGLYLDFTQSRYNNLFQQLNLNLELYTEAGWVVRANGYFPLGQLQGTGLQTSTGAGPGQLTVINTVVGTGGVSHQWMDVAMMGGDWELGYKLLGYGTEVYGGYYNWNGPLAGFANGVKGGIRSYLTPNLSANVNISHDRFFGTNIYSGLTYFFGGPGGSAPRSFQNLMTLPAQRSQQVAIGNYTQDINTFRPLQDQQSGDTIHMYFVQEGGSGTGTQSSPSNVISVLGNPMFGHGSAMVLLDAGGNITSPIGLTQDRQQVIGGGSTGSANVDFSLALGQAPGTSVVHLTNLGGQPVLAPLAGNAITLTDQDHIQGFTIGGLNGLTNGIVGHPGAVDTTIRDMVIRNISGTGILIQPSTNTAIDNVTFANNGADVILNAANSTITNVTSTGAVNGSLNLGGGAGDITGTTLISNVSINGAGGFGGILLNNAQNGATINLSNVSIGNGNGSGVTVTNSQAGSVYNLTNVDVTTVGGQGMQLTSSSGVFNVDSNSSITDTGAAALGITGGAIDLNFAGNLLQRTTAESLLVTGNHTGTAIFTVDSHLAGQSGKGMQFDGANGSYTFDGLTTMLVNNNDSAMGVVNSHGTFLFTGELDLSNTLGKGLKIVGSAGNHPVTTFQGRTSFASTADTAFHVSDAGLTTVTGIANINAYDTAAMNVSGTQLAATFQNIVADDRNNAASPTAITISGASGTFAVTDTAQILFSRAGFIDISNSPSLTSTFHKLDDSFFGSPLTSVLLSNAGSVEIQGGTIQGTVAGLNSSDTNLTVDHTTILSSNNSVVISNTGSPHTVVLTNDSLFGGVNGLTSTDSGTAGELVLKLDANTYDGNSGKSISITGSALNSTIVESMNGGKVFKTGVEFQRVTFDGSGAALSGTQAAAGNWTIGLTGSRVQGDGLRFDGPSGDLAFGTLNIANNAGTGLYVDTKTLGTVFSLTTTGGTIDTTGGAATFLDPLTTHMTLNSVTSTNSPGHGLTLDTVAGSFNILGTLTITNAAQAPIVIQNTTATYDLGTTVISP